MGAPKTRSPAWGVAGAPAGWVVCSGIFWAKPDRRSAEIETWRSEDSGRWLARLPGGNLAGGLLKKLSLGTILNSILGILGGGLGGQLLKLLGVGFAGGAGTGIGSIIGNIATGGVGSGVLMAIVGAIKKALSK